MNSAGPAFSASESMRPAVRARYWASCAELAVPYWKLSNAGSSQPRSR